MKARDQTQQMLKWWLESGVHYADLGIKQSDGTMIRHLDLPLNRLPLSWARWKNSSGSEIYIRPARGHSWPLAFLDDVDINFAIRISRKYAALVVQTSNVGGCHVWLRSAQSMDEDQRYQAQRWLAIRSEADLASTSGEHFGRLAGTKNWKRKGVWVNIIAKSIPSLTPSWNPKPALENRLPVCKKKSGKIKSNNGIDQSESGKEWGWICGALKSGVSSDKLYNDLVKRARPRRGKDTERYAKLTLKKAKQKIF